MAIIGEGKNHPRVEFPKEIGQLGEDEVFIFLRPDRAYHTATTMVLSMAATCIGRFGSPFKASDLAKVSQIGIFATWEANRKMGKLCDEEYFSRQHVGTEEYFTPEAKFFQYVRRTSFERRSKV